VKIRSLDVAFSLAAMLVFPVLAAGQESEPAKVVLPTDRTVLPIPEPQYHIAPSSMPGMPRLRHAGNTT
jgi:hypothetical protein